MHVIPVVSSKQPQCACVETEWKGARVLLLMLSFRKLWCDCAPYLKIPSLSPTDVSSISEEFCYGFTLFIRCVTTSQISSAYFFFLIFTYHHLFLFIWKRGKWCSYSQTKKDKRNLLTVTVVAAKLV